MSGSSEPPQPLAMWTRTGGSTFLCVSGASHSACRAACSEWWQLHRLAVSPQVDATLLACFLQAAGYSRVQNLCAHQRRCADLGLIRESCSSVEEFLRLATHSFTR
jgi:hypothetical protein